MPRAWLFAFAVASAPAAHAQMLTYEQALERAEQSPLVAARAAALDAAEVSVRPAGALPDPQLMLGLRNVPATGPDRFRFDREPMTMQTIGIMQEMPSGAERRARRAVARADATRAEAALELARLEARIGAARGWVGVHYTERRLAILRRLREEARALAEAARVRLAAGAGSLDDAIAAEIEAARIEDRLAEAEATLVASRAELSRWIGPVGGSTAAPPAFAVAPALLRANLRQHPALAAYAAEAEAANADLGLARAERWPDWSWQVEYGRRDEVFGDMASVEVRIGLPLFQGGRQAPLIEARRRDVARATAEREAATREYASLLDAGLSEYAALSANLDRAHDVRLTRAREQAEAATGAFAAGAITLPQLIAARRLALEAEVEALELEQRRAALAASLNLQFAGAAP